MLHTKIEVIKQIEILRQTLARTRQNPRAYDMVNMFENHIEDLEEVLEDTNWNLQLADCDHLFLINLG